MQTLKADFDFFLNYRQKPRIFKSAWVYRWRFFRYFITRAGLFVLGLRLGYALKPLPRLQALYFFFYNLFWGSDISPHAKLGPGLYFPHPLGIVIGSLAVVDGNSLIFNDITIGKKHPGTEDGMPKIGKNVLVGAGARLLGSITIGDDVMIGCNSVVTKSVPPGHTVVGVNQLLSGKNET